MKSSKARILLIKPPYKRLRGVYDFPYIPLGLAYLSSYLQNKGYDTLIYNADAVDSACISIADEAEQFKNRHHYFLRYSDILKTKNHESFDEFRRLLACFNPDIAGISVLSNETGSASAISQICKEFNPDTPIVWGGAHPTFLPENVLKNYPWVDYLVLGEGEKTFSLLCSALSSGTASSKEVGGIKGIAYRDEQGLIKVNPDSTQISDLDEIPFPDFKNLAFRERYRGMFMGNIIASRGCPYRCGFCSSRSFWKNRVRYRSFDNIIEEINFRIRDLGINHFTFVDDSFTIKPDTIYSLCEKIARNRIPFFWGTMTRADLIETNILKMMKKAGCIHIHFGIETGSQETARIIKKDLDLERARGAIQLVQEHSIPVGTFFIIGFPEETEENIMETYEYIRSVKPSRIGFNIFEPQPGAFLYNYLVDKNIIAEDAVWDNFPMFPDGHYMLNVSFKDFARLADMVGNYVFSYNSRLSTKIKNYKVNLFSRLIHDPSFYAKKLRWFIKRRINGHSR